MSRRNKRKATVERAAPSYSGPMGIQGDYAKYGGGTSVTIPAHILSQMLQNVAPQKNQAQDFAPGSPLTPYQGVVPLGGPRQWSYNVGSNLNTNDRTLGNPEVPTFAQLRNLAMLYSGIGLCERVLLDMIPKLIPNVTLKKVFAEAGAQEKDYQPRIAKWRTLLEYPSPAQNLDIHSWLRMAWIEQTQIDALALFKHKTRGGGLYGLEIIDGACYSDEVEVLTKSGWKLFQDVTIETDLFATRNPDSKVFEWQKATYYHEVDWDSNEMGNLYHFTSRTIDLPVTPNHRMVVNKLPRNAGGSRHRQPGEVILTAQELAEGMKKATTQAGIGIPATSQWSAPDVEEVHVPATTPRSREILFSGDDFAAFMGMWLAEGCATNGDQVVITQSPTSKGFEPYKEILERIWKRSVCHTGHNFVIGHKALHDYLKQFGHAHEKFIPDIILNMSKRQMEIFWHYYVLGDGGYDKSKNGTIRERITTTSKEMVDDLQELLQKMGYSGSISTKSRHDCKMADGRIIKKENQRTAYVLSKRTTTYQQFSVKRIPYKGKVYCVSVPNEILYVRHNGKPAWCGNTIKPVIDERGMVPDAKAGFPAYQQYPYGVPGDLYTTDQMIYYRESPRAFTPYGLSRVERIIMEVNQALRKKRKDLLRFTEGNVPQGIMEVPPDLNWTPDQIDAYEQMWNALISGNASMQVRVKFTQPGMKYTRLDPEDIMTPFDEFLLNISAAAYGLSMQDLAFTGDIHKSSGDSQQNVMFRRTLAPFILVYSRLLTQLFAEAFHDDMLEVTFGGFEEPEDLQSQASAYSMLVQNAIISPAGVARIMKLPEVPETGPFILPKGGQPVFLENLADPAYRKAQQDAQMAGLQLATQGPQAQPGQEEDEEDTDAPSQSNGATPKQGKQTKSDEESPAVQRLITQVEELIARLPLPDDRREERNQREQSAQRTAEVRLFPFPIMGRGESDASTGQTNAGAPGSDHAEKERSAELRRWRKRAIDDAKAGKAQRGFTTTLIPEAVHARISVELAECHTVEDVHTVFERARERDTPPFAATSIPAGSQSGGSQEPSKNDWRPKW